MIGIDDRLVKDWTSGQRRRGIPTTFDGVRYRSRHEAMWAATFKALGLRAEYEPCDLDGYLPDFDLRFDKRPLLIEIKPAEEDFELAKSKIECSGWTGEAAILVSAETRTVGIMFDGEVWDTAVFAFCLACHRPTIIQECGDWTCRNCNGGPRDLWWAWDARAEWVAAKNLAQWRAA
jgi:hypothetical protein